MAVDLFNGNFDRFDSDGEWVNNGNVMFAKVPGVTVPKVVGLDMYDPNAEAASNLVKPGGNFAHLKILTDSTKMREFVCKCAESVGEYLSGVMVKGQIGFLTFKSEEDGSIYQINDKQVKHLFGPYALKLEEGLIAGARELKQYLQNK